MTNMQHLRCIPYTLLTSHSCTKHFYACVCIFLGATCFALFAVLHQGVHPPAHLANAQMNIFLTGGFP